MLPRQTTVLIVGAGPTGLAAAISLAHQGCKDLVVIDAVEQEARTSSSRAIVVHSATMESLETIHVADDLISHGIKASSVSIYTVSDLLARAHFSQLKEYTRYPFTLFVSQYSTERVLEKKAEELGLRVERPCKLVGLSDAEDDGEGQGLLATFDNGETIRARYVIGADGARSTVRQLLKISFADPDGASIEDTAYLIMADVTFSNAPFIPRDDLIRYFAPSQFFVCIPIPRSPYAESYQAEGIFRIGFSVPKEDGPPPPSPGVDVFQELLNKHQLLFLNPVEAAKIDKMLWSTRVRLHAAIANKFLVPLHAQNEDEDENRSSSRVVFLIGDAAHIQSPLGGQGMNLGLCDAIGLGAVITKHMETYPQNPSTADKLLEEFETARHASAISTIRVTKRAMDLTMLLGSDGWMRYFRWAAKLLFKVPAVTRAMLWELSGLGRI